MARGKYKGPQGLEGLVPIRDKNGKPTGEYREADPEGWYRRMQVKNDKGKTKKEVEKLLAKKLKKKGKTA